MEEIIYSQWQDFCDGVVKIFNTPTCIAGVTIGTLLFTILVIISRTSLGKKAFVKLKGLLTKSVDELKNAKEEIVTVQNEFSEYKANKEAEFKAIKEEYEIKLVGARQEAEKVEELLLTIAENIHNGKVQQAVNEYIEQKKNETEQQISSIVEIEKEKARSEYEQEIYELKQQLDEVKAIINEGAVEVQENAKEIHDEVNEVIEDVKETKDNITNL